MSRRRPGFSVAVPWGSWLGLARTLLATSTAATLVFNDVGTLFTPLVGAGPGPHCVGPGNIGAFCLAGPEHAELVRWASVAVLLVVASGWRPRFTALPHWWIAFSLSTSMSIPDGGEQVNQVITLLLIPVLLADSRRWHWQPPPSADRVIRPGGRGTLLVATAVVLLFAIRLQVAGIYFQASVAKFSKPEWADGTVMYYWLNHRGFGSPGWLQPVTDALVNQPVGVALLTWTPLAIEFALAVSLLVRPAVRWWLLPFGVLLHISIAMLMGLWSFSIIMIAAQILLLVPMGTHLPDTWRTVREAVRRRPARKPEADTPDVNVPDVGSPSTERRKKDEEPTLAGQLVG
ncbi:sporulation-delaying protein SdpB family protein [Micromonospora sp. DT48]|uniref:sporulation-delaying protein SdpB family protein n=1 Tax=unclassified Micromonospora TaxID=2617518 RepID=UPI0012BBF49F|nr:sporulation-delaying protein SdpB family protein [Micromonospora sp. CP22]